MDTQGLGSGGDSLKEEEVDDPVDSEQQSRENQTAPTNENRVGGGGTSVEKKVEFSAPPGGGAKKSGRRVKVAKKDNQNNKAAGRNRATRGARKRPQTGNTLPTSLRNTNSLTRRAASACIRPCEFRVLGRNGPQYERSERSRRVDAHVNHMKTHKLSPRRKGTFGSEYADHWTPKMRSPARGGYDRLLSNSLFIGLQTPQLRITPQSARDLLQKKEHSATGFGAGVTLGKCCSPFDMREMDEVVKQIERQVEKEQRVMQRVMEMGKLDPDQEVDLESISTDGLVDSDDDEKIARVLKQSGFRGKGKVALFESL